MDNGVPHKHILGIILAGGKSRRMGQNKTVLSYHGTPLIAHMLHTLTSANIENTVISGTVAGYDHMCVPDTIPFAGPAHAIGGIMHTYPDYDGYAVVPVDMPLLRPDMIQILLQQPQGATFQWYPLPAYIVPPPHAHFYINPHTSIKQLLQQCSTPCIPMLDRFKPYMKNANTPEQWQHITDTRR